MRDTFVLKFEKCEAIDPDKKPDYEVMLHGPNNSLVLGRIERAEYQTPFGSVPCWAFTGKLEGFDSKTLGKAKEAAAEQLFDIVGRAIASATSEKAEARPSLVQGTK